MGLGLPDTDPLLAATNLFLEPLNDILERRQIPDSLSLGHLLVCLFLVVATVVGKLALPFAKFGAGRSSVEGGFAREELADAPVEEAQLARRFGLVQWGDRHASVLLVGRLGTVRGGLDELGLHV